MIDNYGREINYLRVSVTDRCNFRCLYCMEESGIVGLAHQDILSLEELYYVITQAVELGINKVRITGGEPLTRKGILPFIESVGKIPGIIDLAMTTNGALLSPYLERLKMAGLKRINLSLDTLDPDKFKTITRIGNIGEVLVALDKALALGFKVKINCVLMRGINDDEVVDFLELAKNKAIDVRFIELMPIGNNNDFAVKHFISYQEILAKYDLQAISKADIHSPASYYQYQDSAGKIGFITALSNHFCQYCNRLRLTADGKLRPCLLQEIEYDVREALRKGLSVKELITESIKAKPQSHLLNQQITATRQMNKIGG